MNSNSVLRFFLSLFLATCQLYGINNQRITCDAIVITNGNAPLLAPILSCTPYCTGCHIPPGQPGSGDRHQPALAPAPGPRQGLGPIARHQLCMECID
uniref:Putative secreted protein n=1 Tax=Anopheles marajoara TaxID=58244 RepID=A0A2M4C905_9DIPT